jgi:outer membrane immunogenic protein
MATKAPPPVVAPSWTGWYVGGSFGYGWDNASVGIAPDTQLDPFKTDPGKIASSLGTNPSGWLAGLQLGYNYQISKIVFGIEADISLADMSGDAFRKTPALVPPAFFTTFVEQRLKSFGTFRGRVGFTPVDNLLIYGTGGLAFGNTQDNGNITRSDPNPNLSFGFPASTTATRTGWTVGGGAEYALTKRWSVKGEYLYYDLGQETLTGIQPPRPIFLPTGSLASYTFLTRGSIVRLGLNLKIN